MKSRRQSAFIHLSITTLVWLSWGGCSTTQVAPPAPPTPPTFTQVPHPVSYELGDLKGLFFEHGAPDRESLKDCDKGFFKLKAATTSVEEQKTGIAELVRHDPVAMHWCFYDRVAFLEDDLKKEPYVDVRQKKVLTTYEFLVPIARAFTTEFHDSRYLRAAIQRYRKLSEWVFYRRLDASPKVTSELVELATPFGIWKEPGGPTPILDKYGIVQQGPATVTAAQPAPATAPMAAGLEQTGNPMQEPSQTPPGQTPPTVVSTQGQSHEAAMLPGGRAPAGAPNGQPIAAQPDPVAPPPPAPKAAPAVTESVLNGDEVIAPPPAPAAPATPQAP